MKYKILKMAPVMINFVLSAILSSIELNAANYSAAAGWFCSMLGWMLVSDIVLEKEIEK